MPSVNTLRVKLFADGADLGVVRAMAANSLIKGVHHEPHSDAEGGHQRLRCVLERDAAHRAGSSHLVRGVLG